MSSTTWTVVFCITIFFIGFVLPTAGRQYPDQSLRNWCLGYLGFVALVVVFDRIKQRWLGILANGLLWGSGYVGFFWAIFGYREIGTYFFFVEEATPTQCSLAFLVTFLVGAATGCFIWLIDHRKPTS